ncbi:MAG: hypothetical protein KGZ73_05205 [Rhizobiales bacterium]|nr:hypothetical protein [Hyphomicrobiales bacterium]
MTKDVSVEPAQQGGGMLFFLANPDVGNHDLVISYGSAPVNVYGIIFTMKDVKQTSSKDATSANANASGTSVSSSNTTTVNNDVVLGWVVLHSGASSISSNVGTDLGATATSSTGRFLKGSYIAKDTAGSQSMTFNWSGSGGADLYMVSYKYESPVTNVTVEPSVLSATFSLPAATITAVRNTTQTPSALSATFSLPSASVSGSALVTPSVLSATFSIPAVDVLLPDALVTPSVLSLSFSVPAVSVTGDCALTVSPLSAQFSLPSASVSVVSNTTLTPSPLSAVFSVLGVRVLGNRWENQSRPASSSLTNQSRPSTSWVNQERTM